MPRITHKRQVLKTGNLTLEEKTVEFRPGVKQEHQSFNIGETGYAVMIVALDHDGNILMLREFMSAVEETQLGLPKGKIEFNQTPEQAAKKELLEEVGITGTFESLGIISPSSPAYLGLRTYAFLVTNIAIATKEGGDEMENLHTESATFDDVESKFIDDPAIDPRVIVALLRAKKRLRLSRPDKKTPPLFYRGDNPLMRSGI